MMLSGNWQTLKVRLDGKPLSPKQSQRWSNHSPDGFAWGYGGSGPAQLALAVLLRAFEIKGRPNPLESFPFDYQQFKWDVIARLPQADFSITLDRTQLVREYGRRN